MPLLLLADGVSRLLLVDGVSRLLTEYAPPAVTITAPTAGQVIAAGGPTLTVNWTYSQAEGLAQATYRVRIQDPLGRTTFYDSGVLSGAVTTWSFDAVAGGVWTDTTGSGSKVIVDVTSATTGFAATDSKLFDIQWGTVTCTITTPVGGTVLGVTALSPTWTFASTRGQPQTQYRLRLLSAGSGAVLYDSGFVSSAASSAAVGPALVDANTYTVEVTLKNAMGVSSGAVTVTFAVDIADPAAAYTPLDSVGVVEAVGINGVGYMLLTNTDFDQGDIRKSLLQYRRETVPLDPQRFASSSTPFTEAIDHYSFIALSDFTGGAGQRFANRPASSPNRFYDSEGINPFTPGEASLLPAVAFGVNTWTQLRAVPVGTRLYVQTGAKQISWYDTVAQVTANTPAGTLTIAAATTIYDLTTDGISWFAACGAQGIFTGTTVDPGAAWSAQLAYSIGFAAGRICAGVATSGTTPNRFTTLNSLGVEEVANGRVTLAVGVSITNFTSGGGYVWFGVYAGDKGWVYVWDLTAATPFVALEPLPGQAVRQVFYGQGQVFVRVERRSSATASTARIYRCPIGLKGDLTPFAVLDLLTPAATDHGPGVFGGDGDRVFFSWVDQDAAGQGKRGLGAISLTTGGYCKWHQGGVGTSQVRAIFRWQGQLCFTVDGVGIYAESPTAFLTTGTLTTSAFDQGSALSKVYDFISLTTSGLRAGETVGVAYVTDPTPGTSYTAFPAADITGVGLTRKQTPFSKKGAVLALKLTFTGSGATTPKLNVVQVRLHPIGLADTIIVLPIACGDDLGNLQGGSFIGNSPDNGFARARILEGLVQSRVLFQDIDYQDTLTATVMEVISVDVRGMQLDSRHTGRNSAFLVAITTLRTAAK